MRAILLINPHSGLAAKQQNEESDETDEMQIQAALQARGVKAEIWHAENEDAWKAQIQQAIAEGVELVIVAGGDGTIHTTATSLIGSNCVLGIIALGTMNNLARSLNIPESIDEACEIIANGETRSFDVGKLNDRYFLEVAGVGLEAELFPSAEEIKSPGWHTKLWGMVKGLATLIAFRPHSFSLLFDGKDRYRGRTIEISICNSPYYGARLHFAPEAAMDDGQLNALLYIKPSKLTYLWHALAIIYHRHHDKITQQVIRRPFRTLDIRTRPHATIHLDGLPNGKTPAHIEVVPAALHIRVPLATS